MYDGDMVCDWCWQVRSLHRVQSAFVYPHRAGHWDVYEVSSFT